MIRIAPTLRRQVTINDVTPPPDYQIGKPASFDDMSGSKDQRGASDFWSNVRAAVSNWLQEPVPEYDLESGRVVGERPRWRAIAPYVGIPAATGAIFGGEAAGLPAVLSALGFGGGAVETTAGTTEAASQASAIISAIAQEQANLGVSGLTQSMSASSWARIWQIPQQEAVFWERPSTSDRRRAGNTVPRSFYIQ